MTIIIDLMFHVVGTLALVEPELIKVQLFEHQDSDVPRPCDTSCSDDRNKSSAGHHRQKLLVLLQLFIS